MVLREAALASEVERRKIPILTGYEERGAPLVAAVLLDRGLLVIASYRAPLRLAFPSNPAEHWFPRLYPVDMGAPIR